MTDRNNLPGVRCRNHPPVAATHTASMPKATAPYRENVPLCGECAPRIETIGFPTSPLGSDEDVS